MPRSFEDVPEDQPELPTGPAEIPEQEPEPPQEAQEDRGSAQPPQPPPAPVAAAPATLTKATGKLAVLRDKLALVFPTLAQLVPAGLDAKRLYVLASLAIERQPALQDCTVISIVRGVLNAAQLGLDPTGLGGQAYLIPRKNRKTGQLEACFELGYRGIIALMTRDRRVIKVVARVVRGNDRFQLLCGSEEKLVHAPYIQKGDPGEVDGAYAVATFFNGMTQFDYMTIDDLLRIKKRSQAGDSGPWATDPEEMMKKTVTKRLGKYVASDPAFDYGMSQDDAAEVGLEQSSVIAEDVIEAAIVGSQQQAPAPVKGGAPRRGGK